jgi:hypothetical protein
LVMTWSLTNSYRYEDSRQASLWDVELRLTFETGSIGTKALVAQRASKSLHLSHRRPLMLSTGPSFASAQRQQVSVSLQWTQKSSKLFDILGRFGCISRVCFFACPLASLTPSHEKDTPLRKKSALKLPPFPSRFLVALHSLRMAEEIVCFAMRTVERPDAMLACRITPNWQNFKLGQRFVEARALPCAIRKSLWDRLRQRERLERKPSQKPRAAPRASRRSLQPLRSSLFALHRRKASCTDILA